MSSLISEHKHRIFSYSLIALVILSKIAMLRLVEKSEVFFLGLGYDLLLLCVIAIIFNSRKKMNESMHTFDKCIIDNLPYAVFCKNSIGCYIECNKAFEKFANKSKQEIIGRTLFDIFSDELREEIDKSDKELQIHLGTLMREFEHEGHKYIIKKSSVTNKKNEFEGIVGAIIDMTEMESMEEKLNETLKMDKLKKDFFSNVSHELRTPINVMLSSVQMIEQNIEDRRQSEKYFKMLKQNGYRTLKLVNNLIDLTKIDAGYYAIEVSNHNIVQVVEEILMSVRGYTKCKNIELTFDTEQEEIIIACDPEKIERIILNLISNAIKFSKDKDGKIDVNIFMHQDYVEISVKDNGIGIEHDKIDKIFQRFVQIGNECTRNKEGSGIGLSLVQSLVELHGGHVKVNSEFGKGSEFVVKLPNVRIEKSGELCDETEKKNVLIELSDV